jgi:2-succinyl-5-enolpyruvyl-6-hydroxy-3-cyclohexene-1-carboxylate synthase
MSAPARTIDQIKLYGDAVRWFCEVGNHDVDDQRLRWIRALACRAVAEACGERPGPVHLNWPLREPLVPDGPVEVPPGRSDGAPWVRRARGRRSAEQALELDSARGVIVAGGGDAPGAAVARLAADAGYALLADPLSGARRCAAAIAHYDLLLRDSGFADAHAPDVVVRVGDLPTCKPLREWLAGLGSARQIALDSAGAWQDPACVVELSLDGGIERLSVLAPRDPTWLDGWRDADARAGGAVAAALGGGWSELGVARALAGWLPANATLFVGASMPVREIELVWPVLADPPRVLANRGANGIDGTLSSAFGVAAAGDGTAPVCALVGDVTFAHDIGGLLAASRLGLAVTIVLLDNGGGGIFDHLPIAGATDVFEEHIATPTGLDFEHAASLYRLEYAAPASLGELEQALGAALARRERSTLLHLRFDRDDGVATLQRLHAAAVEALG